MVGIKYIKYIKHLLNISRGTDLSKYMEATLSKENKFKTQSVQYFFENDCFPEGVYSWWQKPD